MKYTKEFKDSWSAVLKFRNVTWTTNSTMLRKTNMVKSWGKI